MRQVSRKQCLHCWIYGTFHLVDGLRSVALALKNSLTNLQFEIASFMLINSVQYSYKSPCLSLASFLLFLAKRFLPSEKNTDSLKFNQVTHQYPLAMSLVTTCRRLRQTDFFSEKNTSDVRKFNKHNPSKTNTACNKHIFINSITHCRRNLV